MAPSDDHEEERIERLAIDLADLDRIPPMLRAEIIPHIDFSTVLRVGQGEKNEDVAAIAFKCPLLQAAMICDLIRSHDRAVKARPSELYINRGTRWARVIYSTVFTVKVQDKWVLNPSFFSRAEIPAVEDYTRPAQPLRKGG